MAAPSFSDNVKFNPTAGGTTDWTYSSSITGYQSPTAANVVNGATYEIFAISADLTQWELAEGICTITGGIPTFARTTIFYNSSATGTKTPGQSGAGTKINFTNPPLVAIVAPGEYLLPWVVGQLPGTTGTTQPAAGCVGERISGSGTATLSSGVYSAVCSITVTPGVWDIDGNCSFGGPGATTTNNWACNINTVSASSGGIAGASQRLYAGTNTGDSAICYTLQRTRVTVSSNTTYYFNASATIGSGSGYTATANMAATRVS